MRKAFFVLVVLLWIAAGVQLVWNLNREDEDQIVEAFHNTNCMEAESKITLAGRCGEEYLTTQECRDKLAEAAGLLGLNQNYSIEEQVEQNRHIVMLSKEAAGAKVVLRMITLEENVCDNVVATTQYFIGEIELYKNLACAVSYKESMEQMGQQLHVDGQVNLEFQGQLYGKMQEKEMKAIAEQLLDSISARKVSDGWEDGLYTVYGYTKIEENSRKIRGEKVNVNVALSYDEESECTRLYLATPFLEEDY